MEHTAAVLIADIAGAPALKDGSKGSLDPSFCRAVADDFIGKSGGRVVAASDNAVHATFASAVEAVRCAIYIQEGLRAGSLADSSTPPSICRIGVTLGGATGASSAPVTDASDDVARLDGLAGDGGICISRAVHAQVSDKLSVQFADIGLHTVTNSPVPVHAFTVAMRRADGSFAISRTEKTPAAPARPSWTWRTTALLTGLAAVGGGLWYFS